jgi:hypothetical protein
LTVIVALLGSGEPHVLAQRTKQRRANIERKPPLMRVDLKRHICGVSRAAAASAIRARAAAGAAAVEAAARTKFLRLA